MWLLIVFVLYLLMLAGIGVYCVRFNRTLTDFVLGGRRLGPWVTALSAQASDMSAWLLIGLPGMAYAFGLSTLWAVVGCGLGTVFNWLAGHRPPAAPGHGRGRGPDHSRLPGESIRPRPAAADAAASGGGNAPGLPGKSGHQPGAAFRPVICRDQAGCGAAPNPRTNPNKSLKIPQKSNRRLT